VLQDISITINAGERLVLVGPSGCGKTTILRLIAGLIQPDRGTVSVNGIIASNAGHILIPPGKRNLGMVFQDLALWPHLTVAGNLDFVLKAKGLSKIARQQQIEKMLKLVSLTGLDARKPAELSGGQQQRVALARALAPQPKLLLMDEPLASLDQDLNMTMRQEVLRLQQELKFTLVYVTHNREEANYLATRQIKINHGQIS
jgi:ABC-type Fe3+/spermidine/putrescine transport system ATPase subunit